MRVTSRLRNHGEQGAVAIVYALLVVMLISVAALATDLGNAVSRKTTTQTQADFAAYDVASLLTSSARPGDVVTTAMADRARDALNNNQPQWDDNICWRNTPVNCVTSAMLTDGNLANGELRFTSLGLQVISPAAKVDFGLAGAMGFNSTTVSSPATVNVFSPGLGVLPMYAVNGCNEGSQSLTDPANGQTNPVVPALYLDSDQNQMQLSSATLRQSSGTQVDALPYNSAGNTAGYTVDLAANKWRSVTQFGFFRGDNVDPAAVGSATAFWSTPDSGHTLLATPYSVTNNGPSVTLQIPDKVFQTETVWWVRVFDSQAGKWSNADEALPIRVGGAVLECNAGSNGGNFGTLRLPRGDVSSSNDLAMNIAAGFQSPLNLHTNDYAIANALSFCNEDSTTKQIVSGNESPGNEDREQDTNCVATDPGLPAGVATAGLITGVSNGASILSKGLLDATKAGNETTCPGRSNRTVNIQSTNYQVNDDVLSCFLTAGHSLTQIASDTYSGGPALDESILNSPRFVFVPVVRTDPATGTRPPGYEGNAIIDFQPGFITGENIYGTNDSDNGLKIQNNSVKQVKIFFFGFDALPHEPDMPVQDYLGIGDPIIRLIQ